MYYSPEDHRVFCSSLSFEAVTIGCPSTELNRPFNFTARPRQAYDFALGIGAGSSAHYWRFRSRACLRTLSPGQGMTKLALRSVGADWAVPESG